MREGREKGEREEKVRERERESIIPFSIQPLKPAPQGPGCT